MTHKKALVSRGDLYSLVFLMNRDEWSHQAVIMFKAALLAAYCGAFVWYMSEFWSRRLVIDPAPELTFRIRGVFDDFLRSGIKASTMRRGPVALVWKQEDICSEREPVGNAMAALLTMASRLAD